MDKLDMAHAVVCYAAIAFFGLVLLFIGAGVYTGLQANTAEADIHRCNIEWEA